MFILFPATALASETMKRSLLLSLLVCKMEMMMSVFLCHVLRPPKVTSTTCFALPAQACFVSMDISRANVCICITVHLDHTGTMMSGVAQ